MSLSKINVRYLKHPFHIVDPSPWPFFTAMAAFVMLFGLALYMHFYSIGLTMFRIGFILVCVVATLWWRDVIREATYEGDHTSYVRTSLRMGMILFIVSEAMLFSAFFWAYFHSCLNPVPQIGSVWPPKGLEAINPLHVPLLNTLVLLNSGVFITYSHYSFLAGRLKDTIEGLVYTIALAIFFTFLQAFEYIEAPFTLSDGIYGSVFFLTTGLHGFHVIIGSIFLIVCLWRLIENHFTINSHVGFESAIWYWHFVDVVWIFVYLFIYYWGYGEIAEIMIISKNN